MASKKNTKQSAANNGRTPDGRFGKGNPHAWQKGVSPNPSGRPKDTITPHLREIAQETDKDGRTYGRRVAEMLYAEALGGNVQAAKEIIDRLEGRSRQGVDLTVDQQRNDAALREDALKSLAELTAALNGDEDRARAILAEDAPTLSRYIN